MCPNYRAQHDTFCISGAEEGLGERRLESCLIRNSVNPALKALADPTRRHILRRMGDRKMSAGYLAQLFDMVKRPDLGARFVALD